MTSAPASARDRLPRSAGRPDSPSMATINKSRGVVMIRFPSEV